MNAIFGNFALACRDIWKSIGIAQRISILIVGAMGLAAIGAVLYFGTRPNWHVLYRGLDGDAAARVYEVVCDAGVPVKLKDSGHTIMVPFERVNELRLAVREAGVDVEQAGAGLELFDKARIGLTEMEQRVSYQRAIQGELQRMIRGMPGIRSARVLLVGPRNRALVRKPSTVAKATVFVELKPGHVLSEEQVTSIRSIVSGGGEGIAPEQVTIADSSGRTLARGRSPGAGLSSDEVTSRLAVKARIEDDLRTKVEEILQPVVGPRAVIAVVSVDLDFDAVERVTEKFDKEQSVVLSERVSSDENTTKADLKGGVVGTSGNSMSTVAIGNPTGAGDANTSQETRKITESEYAVPKTTETVKISGPRIKSVGVAVTLAMRKDEGARTETEKQDLEKLVRSAIGAVDDPVSGRSDQVTVAEGEFLAEVSGAGLDPGPSGILDRFVASFDGTKTLAALRPVLGILLLFVLYRIFGTTFRKDRIDSTDILGEALPGPGSPYMLNAGAEDLPPEDDAQKLPTDQILAKVESDPKVVAGMLEAWLAGEKQ